jgi:Uma2 family endonuclease
MIAQPDRVWTVDEYLRFERASESKHEYTNGTVHAMAGASAAHNTITGNIFASLHGQLRSRPCTLFPSDMRLKIPQEHSYTYPDIAVVCGEIVYDDSEQDTLLNPTVLIEVLSPSTEMYDRGKKSQRYRMLPSLREYLLVAQDIPYIEHFVRYSDHQWLLSDVRSTQTALLLPSIDCTLLFSDIYAKVPPSR